MRQSDALTFVGTRLAFHSFEADRAPRDVPREPDFQRFVEECRRLNREACEALGEACLTAYDQTVHILTRGKGF